MTDVLGTRLDRYEIRERLGRGGMATVYKSWDTNLERWVAVKVLHDYLLDDGDFRQRFEREAKLVANLSHPNIVQMYDFNILKQGEKTICYMVMQYVPGVTLRHLMEERRDTKRPFSLREIYEILRGAGAALSYAHGRGMVHRDVTPGNILFNEQGQVVLADFGIARMVEGTRITRTGTTSGTPVYMSPEQGIGEGGDHRSDIYSLGVILFEMLTGRAPYEGDSAFAVLLKHVNEPVPSPLEVNTALPFATEAIIFKALAKDPAARYQTVDEFISEFEQKVLPAEGIQPVPPPFARPAPNTGSRTTRLPAGTQMLPAVGGNPTPTRPALIRALPLIAIAAIAVAIGAFVLLPALGGRGPSGGAEPTFTLAVAPITTKEFAPSMTAGPLLFTDDFGPNRADLLWPITLEDANIYRNIADGYYTIRHSLRARAVTTIFDEEAHSYSIGFSYQADFTIKDNSQPDTAAGIVFRYRNDDMYYVFAVNGQGQVSLWRRQGEWLELREGDQAWTMAEGVQPVGAKNTLRIDDLGRLLRAYVNDVLVIEIETEAATAWSSGAIGVYLATTQSRVDNPMAEVQIDNWSVKEVRRPTRTPTPAPTNAG